MLVHKYELFKMKPNKTIIGMYTRFTDIVNNLKILDKSYTDSELSKKKNCSLPQSQKAKVTMIQEAKDLTLMGLEELLGSLMTHELILNQYMKEEIYRLTSSYSGRE